MTREERLRDSASLTDQCLERSIEQGRMDTLYGEFVKINHVEQSSFMKEVDPYIRSESDL